MDPLSHIEKYMKKHNLSQRAFGERVGVSQGMVWQWLSRRRPIGARRAKVIEKRTGGELKRQELVPEVFG